MKVMPRCKNGETLDLDDFDNFHYFGHDIAYDVTVTSYMGYWYLFVING